MSSPMSPPTCRSILIVGASRGLRCAMAAEFAGGMARARHGPLSIDSSCDVER